MAEGVIKAIGPSGPAIPMVVRLRGVNEDKAKEMLGIRLHPIREGPGISHPQAEAGDGEMNDIVTCARIRR